MQTPRTPFSGSSFLPHSSYERPEHVQATSSISSKSRFTIVLVSINSSYERSCYTTRIRDAPPGRLHKISLNRQEERDVHHTLSSFTISVWTRAKRASSGDKRLPPKALGTPAQTLRASSTTPSPSAAYASGDCGSDGVDDEPRPMHLAAAILKALASCNVKPNPRLGVPRSRSAFSPSRTISPTTCSGTFCLIGVVHGEDPASGTHDLKMRQKARSELEDMLSSNKLHQMGDTRPATKHHPEARIITGINIKLEKEEERHHLREPRFPTLPLVLLFRYPCPAISIPCTNKLS